MALTIENFSRHGFRAGRRRPVYLGLRSWQRHHTRYTQTLSLTHTHVVSWKVYTHTHTHAHTHTHTHGAERAQMCVPIKSRFNSRIRVSFFTSSCSILTRDQTRRRLSQNGTVQARWALAWICNTCVDM
jgi:hypothetical protein